MKPKNRIRSWEITSESNYLNRRQFVKAAGLAAGAWQNLCADCPSVAQIATWEPTQTST